MPTPYPQQIIRFPEQWRKLREAVNEIGHYARMISQVEDILEKDTEIKAKL